MSCVFVVGSLYSGGLMVSCVCAFAWFLVVGLSLVVGVGSVGG